MFVDSAHHNSHSVSADDAVPPAPVRHYRPPLVLDILELRHMHRHDTFTYGGSDSRTRSRTVNVQFPNGVDANSVWAVADQHRACRIVARAGRSHVIRTIYGGAAYARRTIESTCDTQPHTHDRYGTTLTAHDPLVDSPRSCPSPLLRFSPCPTSHACAPRVVRLILLHRVAYPIVLFDHGSRGPVSPVPA